jgi:hypothetical protein
MNNTITVQTISKKETRKIIYEKLSAALTEYKASIKEKKFVNNLKKASKLFAADLAKTIGKKKVKPQKQSKKKTKEEVQSKQSS